MSHSRSGPIPIIALDVPGERQALELLDRIGPAADFAKVGLQLFVAAGPPIVRVLRERGCRVFLDLKLHDIPNTVAKAVESAASLGVDLLTLHASGGRAMLEAGRKAADAGGTKLLAVTVLTSLSDAEVAEAWGRPDVLVQDEVTRLAGLAADTGMDGVVASVHEVEAIRRRAPALQILTPGIRLPGDSVGDQTRVATPAEAARLGADYLVIGRSVTAAADPARAYARVLEDAASVGEGAGA